MLKEILESPALGFYTDTAIKEPSLLVEGLWDGPKAVLCLLAAKATNKHIVIISGAREDRLLDDLSFFGNNTVLDLLPWETLPGEDIAPSSDITGKRLEILHMISQAKKPLVIHCSLQAILQRTISPKNLQKLCHEWKKGDTICFSKLSDFLINR